MNIDISHGQSTTRFLELSSPDSIVCTVGDHAVLRLYVLVHNVVGDVTISLEVGTGASATIRGCVVVRSGISTHIHTLQQHGKPGGKSDLLIRSCVGKNGSAAYFGSIRIGIDAHGSDAFQKSDILLCAPGAHGDNRPELEISADDIRCTHGATTQSFDPESLWYLMSRGLPEVAGKRMLLEGFASQVLPPESDKMHTRVRNSVMSALSRLK